MSEYAAKKRTQSRGQVNSRPLPTQDMTNGIPNRMLSDVFAGKRSATSDMMGRRSNLAPSIAAKMSQAFGMDVSGVQVYRSDAMSGSSMHGMASGNKVVLGSDVDLNTMEGQAILGHELSHIRAQSMGIGTGSGLLQNAALEQQADSEGMMAARGMSISGESMGMSMGFGMAGVENLTPVGPGMSASAGAPMQAKKPDDDVQNDMDTIKSKKSGGRALFQALYHLHTENGKLDLWEDTSNLRNDEKKNVAVKSLNLGPERVKALKPKEQAEFLDAMFAEQDKLDNDMLAEYQTNYAMVPKEFSDHAKEMCARYAAKNRSDVGDRQGGWNHLAQSLPYMFEDSDVFEKKFGEFQDKQQDFLENNANGKIVDSLRTGVVDKEERLAYAMANNMTADQLRAEEEAHAKNKALGAKNKLIRK